MRNNLLNLKLVDPLLIQTFEVGKTHTFNPVLEVGRHTCNLATPSAGSPYENTEGRSFCALPACPHLASKSIPYWHCSLLIWDSRVYWRPAETSSLVNSATNRFLDLHSSVTLTNPFFIYS